MKNIKANKIYLLNDKCIEDTVNLPMYDIKYLDIDINFEDYEAIIFTSKNAIKAINTTTQSWKEIPSYVIAPQTAKILRSLGGKLQYIGTKNHGNEFAREICSELKNKKVLYLSGKKTVSNLQNILIENGVFCDNVVVYETVCKKYDKKLTLPKSSVIIFSSPSTIEFFLENTSWDSSFKAVCIGKTTAEYLPSYIEVCIADTTSLESCVQKAKELL